MFFAAGPLEAAMINKALGMAVPQGRERTIGYGTYSDAMNAPERAVSQSGYIAGGSFTAADVYVGAQIGWGLQFSMIEKRSAFERYWERVSTRPASRRAVEIDDALIAAQQPTKKD